MRPIIFIIAFFLVACETAPINSDSATAESPQTRAALHTQLAVGYLQRDQKRTALDELNRALEIAPNHSEANYVMAMLQTSLGDMPKADQYYRKALASDPKNSRAAHDYGVFLCSQGKVEQALEYFNRALQDPLYLGGELTNLRAGECLIRMRTDRRAAEQFFRQSLNLNPRSGLALYYMADILYARRQYLKARAYIERYFSFHPDTAASLLLGAKIESKLGSKDVAIDYATRLRSQFPRSDEALQLKVIQ